LGCSGRQVDGLDASIRAVGLPCPWAPLQSVTTAASRRNVRCRRALANRRSGALAQGERRASDDLSHGVRLLSACEPGRSLRRFTSPAPSALGVSHSLSGLSPPGPRGFVSRHIRPQDFGLQSFSLPASRDTSRCPLLSCRFGRQADLELRLQSVAPTENPYSSERG
jgi:hypothetical protein